MADVLVFHNTACSTSRRALDEVAASTHSVEIVQYLKSPPSRESLLELIAKLEDPPADLIRKDPFFRQLGLNADDYVTPEAVADLLVQHPRLMQRPVLVRGNRAIIGRPTARIQAFLAG
jgi:arsenate reductase (glutaredoxin)